MAKSGYKPGPLCALRKDLIFIIPDDHDGWLVVPGHKPVCPGQPVVWQVFSRDNNVHMQVEAEIRLPAEVFDPPTVILDSRGQGKSKVKGKAAPGNYPSRGQGKSKVKDKAAPGNYPYEVICNGQPASGGSQPSVIVDWR